METSQLNHTAMQTQISARQLLLQTVIESENKSLTHEKTSHDGDNYISNISLLKLPLK